jgi:hypothetical protein
MDKLLLVAGAVATASAFWDLTTAAATERFEVIETDQSEGYSVYFKLDRYTGEVNKCLFDYHFRGRCNQVLPSVTPNNKAPRYKFGRFIGANGRILGAAIMFDMETGAVWLCRGGTGGEVCQKQVVAQ